MSNFLSELFIKEKCPLFLAPMSGFSDIFFREICKELGADCLVSEFVQSEPLIRNNPKTWRDIGFTESQRPMGIQIFGANPNSMSKAASLIEERLSPNFIDLNFGCPARKVVEQNAGSSLLRDLPLLEKIAKQVVESVHIPVSAKIRLGWSSSELVAVEVAKRLENVGIQMITVHGRTRSQGYSGEADWIKISEVANAVQIPVVGNGDIKNAETAQKHFKETGVSGLMIGRGALGNPWIFTEIKNLFACKNVSPASRNEKLNMLLRYAKEMCEGNDYVSANNIRSVLAKLQPFTYGFVGGKLIRGKLSSCHHFEDLEKLILSEMVSND